MGSRQVLKFPEARRLTGNSQGASVDACLSLHDGRVRNWQLVQGESPTFNLRQQPRGSHRKQKEGGEIYCLTSLLLWPPCALLWFFLLVNGRKVCLFLSCSRCLEGRSFIPDELSAPGPGALAHCLSLAVANGFSSPVGLMSDLSTWGFAGLKPCRPHAAVYCFEKLIVVKIYVHKNILTHDWLLT